MAITEKYVSSTASGSGDGNSEGTAYTVAQMISTAAAGIRFNIKAGTYSRTSGDNMSATGTATSPIMLRGYGTTPGDGYQGRANSGKGALITTNMPLFSYSAGNSFQTSAHYIILECIRATGDVNNKQVTVNQRSVFRHCVFTNSNTGTSACVMDIGNKSLVIDSDLFLTGATGGECAVYLGGEKAMLDSCQIWVTSAAAYGVRCRHNGVVIGNLIKVNGSHGIRQPDTDAYCYIRSNTIVGASDGINAAATTEPFMVVGNIIVNSTAYGINMSAPAACCMAMFNRYRDNVSGNTSGGTDWIAGSDDQNVTTDLGGDSQDFVNAAGGDYMLVSTSPAAKKSVPPYSSIGAFNLESGGGGGEPVPTPVFNPLAQTIIRPAT